MPAARAAASLDLAVEALDGIGRVELRLVGGGEADIGQHVGFDLVHEGGELGDLGAELVGDLAPLGAGGFGVLLGEGGGDERRDAAMRLRCGPTTIQSSKPTRDIARPTLPFLGARGGGRWRPSGKGGRNTTASV
jgi:hypothetical protein